MRVELSEKRYHSIGEVAEAFGVNTSLIRFWEKEFSQIKPKKNKNGVRYFSKKDIDAVSLIYHLVKERGFTLEGAKEHLKNHPKKNDQNLDLLQKLQKIKATLEELKSNL